MKIFALFLLTLGCAFGQAVYIEPPPALTVSGNPPSGSFPSVLAASGARITICSYPSCASLTQTYTDATAVTPCPTTAQVVIAGTSTCTDRADIRGNFGFWVLTGGQYQYKITLRNNTVYGPYPVTMQTNNAANVQLICPDGQPHTAQDLSSPALGAACVATKAVGTGAVARTQRDKNAEIVSVKDFGAKGDGRIFFGFSIGAGSTALDVPSGQVAAFSLIDVGKRVYLVGAGPTVGSYSAPLSTTIAAIVGPNDVTLADAATAGVTTGQGYIALIGTDDTSAFDAAIASFPNGASQGGTVKVPAGIYLASNIQINNPNISIEGDNFTASVIAQWEDNANPLLKFNAGTITGLGGHYASRSIRNLYLIRPQDTAAPPSGVSGLIETHSDDYIFDSVWMSGGVYGIYSAGSTNLTVSTCTFEGQGRNAIYGENTELSKFVNNTFFTTVTNLDLVTGAAAIRLRSTTGPGAGYHSGVISGNYLFYTAIGHGVWLDGISGVTVTGNFFTATGARFGYPGQKSDVYLTGASYNTVAGNTSSTPENKYNSATASLTIVISGGVATATHSGSYANDEVILSSSSVAGMDGIYRIETAGLTTFTFTPSGVADGTYTAAAKLPGRGTKYNVEMDAGSRGNTVVGNAFLPGWSGSIYDPTGTATILDPSRMLVNAPAWASSFNGSGDGTLNLLAGGSNKHIQMTASGTGQIFFNSPAIAVGKLGAAGGDIILDAAASLASKTTPQILVAESWPGFVQGDLVLASRSNADSAIHLFSGGAEAATLDKNTTANNTRLLLYDVTAGSLRRVSIGAADSGGTGFRVLRIPN